MMLHQCQLGFILIRVYFNSFMINGHVFDAEQQKHPETSKPQILRSLAALQGATAGFMQI